VTEEQRENFREALLADGWYAVVGTEDGVVRLPVWGFQVIGDAPDAEGIVIVHAAFTEENTPPDGATILGAYHPDFKPEGDVG